MDRSGPSGSECAAAVRTAVPAAIELLLPAAAGECEELAADAAVGRTVYGVPVLRQSPDGGYAEGEPQAYPAADADFGYRSALSQTEFEPAGARSRGLPVPAAGRGDRAAQSSLEYRYYVRSDASRLSVSGRDYGLVQSVRAQLGTVQHDGDRLLPGRTGKRVPLRSTRDLELGSRFAVHRDRVSGAVEKTRHLHQYGWTRARPGQCFHRAPVALSEVRVDLPRRLRQRGRVTASAGSLLSLLQSSATASGAGLPYAGRTVSATVNKEEGVVMMGGSAPQTPRDLPLFRPEWTHLFFAHSRHCRTM